MRNLTLLASTSHALQNATILASCIDVENDASYVCGRVEGASTVGIWLCEKTTHPTQVALIVADDEVDASTKEPRVIAFNFLAEARALCVVFEDGRIVTVSVHGHGTVDVVGDVEAGLDAVAWSPDESLVVMITKDGKMLLMTQDFEVLSDVPIQTDDFGEEEAINVGWGSKTTQFHGSLGKTAAQSAKDEAALAARGGISPDDDCRCRVSWRGDGAYYVVSSLDKRHTADGTVHLRRVLRVYNRLGALQTTSEPVPGLEHSLSWRPTGSLIASTQRFGFPGGGAGKPDRHDVVFFERNGLRHGEFALRESRAVSGPEWDYKVKQLLWSSDSAKLAVWIERKSGDAVQLWTTGNYHWYLKHEMSAAQYGESRFSSVTWHPEDPLRILCTTSCSVVDRRFGWETYASRATLPFDSGMVAVVDGAGINLTPFRTQNVPPPMSSYTLASPEACPPIHIAFSCASDALCALWEHGQVIVWDLNTAPVLKGAKPCSPTIAKQWTLSSEALWRQVSLRHSDDGAHIVSALGNSPAGGMDTLHVLRVGSDERSVISLPGSGGRLLESNSYPVWQSATGEICKVDVDSDLALPICSLPEHCPSAMCISGSPDVVVGLSPTGSLFAACEGHDAKTLATNCNSFTTTPGFLIYTTTSHEALFVTNTQLRAHITDDAALQSDSRRVERGSRVVTAVPSAMSLVLQMPRGNLETIYPRPLVLDVVRRDLTAENYRAAFVACRKHRIDLNILVDHDRGAFMRNIALFVDQVNEVDSLNLLLAGLGQSQQTPENIAELCDAIRVELESRDLVRYVNTILTAHVVKSPPDYEAALAVLLRLRETNPDLVEDAAKYVIFLVDADRLFNTALGMYDFSLVLLIAQFSQKDPREYLPFLRELRALPVAYQRFRIDEHLKRYEKALTHLAQAGSERFDEALRFVEKHRLYAGALALPEWARGTAEHKAILDVYGDYLFERHEFDQAALAFVVSGKPDKAMVAYERALNWRELFALAIANGKGAEDVLDMGRRVGDALSSKRRYLDAATVLREYADDVDGAVRALSEGNEFAEAVRIIALTRRPELLEAIVLPGALDCATQLGEGIVEMDEQLAKQVARLEELKNKKDEEPDEFYGVEDPSLHNVDVMTDASAFTAFTRYTKAPTSASGASSRMSRRTSKSKRKLERRATSGRKGTVDEERYLLTSIAKLVTRLAGVQFEAAKLLQSLVSFKSSEHEEAAIELQRQLGAFEKALEAALEEVWKEDRLVPPVGAEFVDKSAMVKVEKPVLEKTAWRVSFLLEQN
ncbi:IkappaB kinase complex, IKAP component [Exidia glandulosa HHB12029]|uniref:Elongator complex protein 1 n=1 Tax=Exidia glandulosa HHB12029 TaxID=1314781 RepID=A0A165CPC8_EXIGL|nr:IkappaB kinase complex, IKAP component [Exidia glandulosa HHB12029]